MHGNKYDYSKAVYKNTDTKVIIICAKHGEFEQTPYKHTHVEQGCPQCAKESNGDTQRMTQRDFLKRCQETHGNTYSYAKARYNGIASVVTIICATHGDFEQHADSHIGGYGCPTCKASRGERYVATALTNINVTFIRQARLIPGKQYAFDFHVPTSKTLIEYNGAQHYGPIAFWGGKRRLDYVRKNDRVKARWARLNGYRLIVVPYTVTDIEGYLRKRLGMRPLVAPRN